MLSRHAAGAGNVDWVMRYALLLLLVACSGRNPVDPPVTAVLGEPVRVRLGQEVVMSSPAASIRFIAVPEDSRCPADVVCVWAGNARVSLRVMRDRVDTTVELNTTVEPRAVLVSGLRIALEGLTPRPAADQAYTAALIIQSAD